MINALSNQNLVLPQDSLKTVALNFCSTHFLPNMSFKLIYKFHLPKNSCLTCLNSCYCPNYRDCPNCRDCHFYSKTKQKLWASVTWIYDNMYQTNVIFMYLICIQKYGLYLWLYVSWNWYRVVMLGFPVSNWISGHALIISLAFFEALISRVILVSSGYVWQQSKFNFQSSGLPGTSGCTNTSEDVFASFPICMWWWHDISQGSAFKNCQWW